MKTKTKIDIKGIVITIVVVGLLSLIPYFIEQNTNKEKKVSSKDEFKLGKMNYQIPKDFEYYLESDDDYRNYNFGEDSSYCNISMEIHSNEYDSYKDGEDYIKKMIYFTLLDEVETTQTNDWYTITIKNKEDYTNRIISAYKYNNDIYALEYSFSDYANGENIDKDSYKKCDTAYDYVFKSINFEE